MHFSGRHPSQPIMQVMELAQPVPGENPLDEHGRPRNTHPYFIGGQFHPELTSRPLRPQPMFMGLIAAAIARKYAGAIPVQDPYAAELARWVRRGSGAGAKQAV